MGRPKGLPTKNIRIYKATALKIEELGTTTATEKKKVVANAIDLYSQYQLGQLKFQIPDGVKDA